MPDDDSIKAIKTEVLLVNHEILGLKAMLLNRSQRVLSDLSSIKVGGRTEAIRPISSKRYNKSD